MTAYNRLLKHPKWFEKRRQILARDGSTCRRCGSDKDLRIHHKQYQFKIRTGRFELPWNYQSRYLITLCDSCHQKGHSIFKIPIIKLNK